jgi:hypothetical protein
MDIRDGNGSPSTYAIYQAMKVEDRTRRWRPPAVDVNDSHALWSTAFQRINSSVRRALDGTLAMVYAVPPRMSNTTSPQGTPLAQRLERRRPPREPHGQVRRLDEQPMPIRASLDERGIDVLWSGMDLHNVHSTDGPSALEGKF